MGDKSSLCRSISVVIPFYNSSDTIEAALDSLRKSTVLPSEVICVDDASDDNGAEIVKRFSNRHFAVNYICHTRNCGPAAARNTGILNSKYDLILFLDADVIVARDCLNLLLENMVNKDCGATVATYSRYSAKPGMLAKTQAFIAYCAYHDMRDLGPWLGTQCSLVRRESLEQVGGFDETIRSPSIEDFDLGIRMYEAGIRTFIVQDAYIVHNRSFTTRSFFNNYYLKARGLASLLLKYPRILREDVAYFSKADLIALFLLPVSCWVILKFPVFHPLGRVQYIGAIALVFVGALMITWREFWREAIMHWSLHEAGILIVMRFAVVLVGAFGVGIEIGSRLLRWFRGEVIR